MSDTQDPFADAYEQYGINQDITPDTVQDDPFADAYEQYGLSLDDDELDTFFEATGKALRNVPERLEMAAAGFMQGVSETTKETQETIEKYLFPQVRYMREHDLVPEIIDFQKYIDVPIELSKDWRENVKGELIPIDVEEGSAAYYGSAAIGSLAEMGPALLGGIITKNPAVTMRIMAPQVSGHAFAEAREKGASLREAQVYSIATAAAEIIPEQIPLGIILKEGGKFFTKVFKGAVAEGIQETLTEAINIGLDMGILNEEMTWETARKRMIDAGIVGTLAGGGMGTIAGGVDVARQKAETMIDPRIDVPDVGVDQYIAEQARQRQVDAARQLDIASETDISGQPITTIPDNITQADIDSPLSTQSISEGRKLKDELGVGEAGIVPTPEPIAPVTPIEPAPEPAPAPEGVWERAIDEETGELLDVEINSATFKTRKFVEEPIAPAAPAVEDESVQYVQDLVERSNVRAEQRDRSEVKFANVMPLLEYIKHRGGIKMGSQLHSELKGMGITNRILPALFRKKPSAPMIAPDSEPRFFGDMDNMPVTEFRELFNVEPESQDGEYVDRDWLLNAIEDERLGVAVGEVTENEILDEFEETLYKLGLDINDSPADIAAKLNDPKAVAEAYGQEYDDVQAAIEGQTDEQLTAFIDAVIDEETKKAHDGGYYNEQAYADEAVGRVAEDAAEPEAEPAPDRRPEEIGRPEVAPRPEPEVAPTPEVAAPVAVTEPEAKPLSKFAEKRARLKAEREAKAEPVAEKPEVPRETIKKPKPVLKPAEAEEDLFGGPTVVEEREAIRRKTEGAKRAEKEQKPAIKPTEKLAEEAVSFEKTKDGKLIAYKVMPVDEDGNVVSGADRRQKFGVLKSGDTIEMVGDGVFVGATPEYVMDFYSGLAENEVLVKVEADINDIKTGETALADKEPEPSFSKVKVVSIDQVTKDGEAIQRAKPTEDIDEKFQVADQELKIAMNEVPAQSIDGLETVEDFAWQNAKVEILNSLWENQTLSVDAMDALMTDNFSDTDSTYIEEGLEKLGDLRTVEEIYEDHLENEYTIDDVEVFEITDDVFEWAKAVKGTTEDIMEAGYILPDGTLLDFSGKKDGGPAGSRAEDHRQISIPSAGSITGTDKMIAFMKMGAMRIDANSGLVDLEAAPTSQQLRKMREVFEAAEKGVVDLNDNGRRASFDVEGEGRAVAGAIRQFYSGRDIEYGKTLFQIAPELRERITDEGLPMFKKPDAEAAAPTTLVNTEAVIKDLHEQLKAAGLKGKVTLSVVDKIRSAITGLEVDANGKFVTKKTESGVERVIEIALNAENPAFTMNHETIHALKNLDLFTKSEWSALTKAAKANTKLMERVNLEWKGQGLTEVQLQEEAIAEMYGEWSEATAQRGFIQKAFDKINQLILSIKSAFTSQGLHSVETVFSDIARGRVGGRDGAVVDASMQRFYGATSISTLLQSAYHGTPHKFSKFTLDHIGAGEGNIAYGWGLYFAENKEIAEWYREKLADDGLRITVNGREITPIKNGPEFDVAYLMLDSSKEEVARQISLADRRYQDAYYHLQGKDVKRLRDSTLYRVQLAPENNEYLLWEEEAGKHEGPALAAMEEIKADIGEEMVEEYLERWNMLPEEWLELRGFALYRTAGKAIMDGVIDIGYDGPIYEAAINGQFEKATSLYLNEKGIRGVKYRDAGSRDKGVKPTHNFVIFDESLIEIEEMFQKKKSPVGGDLLNNDFSKASPAVGDYLTAEHLGWSDRIRMATTKKALHETLDNFRFKFQDTMLPVLRLQQAIAGAGGQIVENIDTYLKQTVMTGRIGSQLERMHEETQRPFFEELHEKNITIEEMETYLYARHAKERNASIAKMNPKFTEGGGSGMTDGQANIIMKKIKESGKLSDLEYMAAKVDTVISDSLQARIDGGLISEEEGMAYRERWQYYVPLRGKGEIDSMFEHELPRPRKGKGIDVKGREYKQAFGRKSEARDILAYIFMQAEETIIRTENNEVAKSFYNMAVTNPNPDIWDTKKITMKPHIDKKTGKVKYRAETKITAEDADYTITAKINGKEHRVVLNRKSAVAVKVADSMRNLSQQEMNGFVQATAWLNRFLSAINTSFNPEFVISNAFRDFQLGVVAAGEEGVDGMKRKVVKDYKSALVAAEKGAFGKYEGEWGKWYREWESEGGRVFFNQVDDIKRMRDQNMKIMKDAMTGKSISKGIRGTLEIIQKVNLGVESAIRLAAYKNLREAGMSKLKAAAASKELTVNFNRKGIYGPVINSLYLFANAAIQGNVKVLRFTTSKTGRKAIGGIVLLGALAEIASQMISGDDEDGEKFHNKIPEYEKSRNWIITYGTGRGDYIKIPAPYGLNVFSHIGRAMVEIASGSKAPTKAALEMVTTAMDSFNPIGGSFDLSEPKDVASLLSPTALDLPLDLAFNKDFTGRNIRPEQAPYGPPVPYSQLKWGSVSPFFDNVTLWANRVTGGSTIEAGLVDVSPETLEYIFGFFTGGAGNFVKRVSDLPQKILDPSVEFKATDIPFVRKFAGRENLWYDRTQFYERLRDIELYKSQIDGYREARDPKSAAALREKRRPELSLANTAKATRKRLSALRKKKMGLAERLEKGIMSKSEYGKAMDRIKKIEQQTVVRFNKRYNERVLGY